MMALPLVWARREYGMAWFDPLAMAFAQEYAHAEQRRREAARNRPKNRKGGFSLLAWLFFGFG